MTEENTYKIISNFSRFNENLEALMYITNDVLLVRNEKLKDFKQTINVLVDSETFDSELFDKIYTENQKVFEDNNIYKHKFDYLFFNSIFINLYSLFEIYLYNLGKIGQSMEGNRIKIKDIKGNGTIDTIRKYFHLILKLEFASSNEHLWNEICEFKAIRNAIVHNENKLNLNKTKNFRSVKGFKKIEQHEILYLGNEIKFELNNLEFIKDFKNICQKYSEKLTRELIKSYSQKRI